MAELDDEDFILSAEEFNYLRSLDQEDALAFIDVLDVNASFAAPTLDVLDDEHLSDEDLSEEDILKLMDELGGLLVEDKAPSLDGLFAEDLDEDFVNFCQSIEENLCKGDSEVEAEASIAMHDLVNASIGLGSEQATVSTWNTCTYPREWQPWEQQATQGMAAPKMKKRKIVANSIQLGSRQATASMATMPQEMTAPRMKKQKIEMPHLDCPRCFSDNTRFDYMNNKKQGQPRYTCRSCNREWTVGGKLRVLGPRKPPQSRKPKGKIVASNENLTFENVQPLVYSY